MRKPMPNRAPVVRGVPNQARAARMAQMSPGHYMAQSTDRGTSFLPGSSCTPAWNNQEFPYPESGLPDGWNGCGDIVYGQVTVPAGATATLELVAPFEFTPREALCSAVFATGPNQGAAIGEGVVLLQQARTANSGTAVFGTGPQAGFDITFYFRTSFYDRRVSYPIYANQPPGERILVNTSADDVLVNWSEIGLSAHMLPSNTGG